MKVPYVADNPNRGGLNSPSDDDGIARMIRDGVEAWEPRRGPDWPDVLMRVAGSGPAPWLVYSAASLALVVILVAAFIIGSYLHIGALAPQPVPANLP
jgi:hypothetical protein